MKIRNTFIIFIVSGFWHGANWTFIVWGTLNAFYFLPLLLSNQNRRNLDIVAGEGFLPSTKELMGMFTTFWLTVLAWVFFRAEDIFHAFAYLSEIFSPSVFTYPEVFPKKVLLLLVAFMIMEWFGRKQEYAIEHIKYYVPAFGRWVAYSLMVGIICYYSGEEQQFIYFRF